MVCGPTVRFEGSVMVSALPLQSVPNPAPSVLLEHATSAVPPID
jgi:hypothetical protein